MKNSKEVKPFGFKDKLGYMLGDLGNDFAFMFASSFFAEHSQTDYNLSSEDLFQAIDKLNLNEQHYIIAFGLYFDYYIGTIKDLKKETDHKYSYKGIQILSLDCSTSLGEEGFLKVKDCVITRNSIKRWNNTKINRNYINYYNPNIRKTIKKT